MRIGITGGTGFIGTVLLDYILKYKRNGFDEITIYGTENKREYLGFEYIMTDYSVECLYRDMKGKDAIVHLAAKRGHGDKLDDFYINMKITENIYAACAKRDIRNVVYASSISVYSDLRLLPWKESQPLSPASFYGISKAIGEYLAEIYHNKYGLNIKSLRLAPVFGMRDKVEFMIDIFLNKAIKKDKLLVVGKSKAKREFVYVKDVVRAILLSLKKYDLHSIINIGSGECYNNLEIARMICDNFNNGGNIEYIDSVDEKIRPSYMDIGKAVTTISYKPRYSFIKALADIKKELCIDHL